LGILFRYLSQVLAAKILHGSITWQGSMCEKYVTWGFDMTTLMVPMSWPRYIRHKCLTICNWGYLLRAVILGNKWQSCEVQTQQHQISSKFITQFLHIRHSDGWDTYHIPTACLLCKECTESQTDIFNYVWLIFYTSLKILSPASLWTSKSPSPHSFIIPHYPQPPWAHVLTDSICMIVPSFPRCKSECRLPVACGIHHTFSAGHKWPITYQTHTDTMPTCDHFLIEGRIGHCACLYRRLYRPLIVLSGGGPMLYLSQWSQQ
jgi:hypothetical protein